MSSLMLTILGILGGIGGIGGVAAAIAILRKTGVEKTDITIKTASTVMIGQTSFIDNLQEQLTEALARIAALETNQSLVIAERNALHAENVKLKGRIDRQAIEIRSLQQRVADLTRSGVAGPKGDTGATGDTGRVGDTGRTGDTGPRGGA